MLNKVLAAFLTILFVICTLIVVVTWSVKDHILDADVYVQALEEADFFQVPYQLIRVGDIPGVGGLLLTRGPLSVVSGTDLEAVARELAPPRWLRAQLEPAIRDLIAVANTPQLDQLPDFVISLREVKARALGEPGGRALSIVVEALPVCAPGREPVELDSDTPVCRSDSADLSTFLNRLKTQLAPLVERVPDTYRVSWQPEQRDVVQDLRRAGRILDQLQFALLFLVALNLALMGLIWLLAVRTPAEWLRWVGVPLLLLGLAALFVAFSMPRVVIWGLGGQTLWTEAAVPEPLAQALEEAIRGFVLLLFQPARLIGVAAAVVGLLLSLFSLLFPAQPRRRAAGVYGPAGASDDF